MLNSDDMRGVQSVLNLGSGGWFDAKERWLWDEIFKAHTKIALDADYYKLESWSKHNSDWIGFCYLIQDYIPLSSKSVDLVIGTDFIEHLNKSWGEKVIKDAERVSKRYIIWFTPVGFMDTIEYQKDSVKSNLDVHYSGWEPEEFEALGYKIDIIENMHNFEDATFDAMWAWKELK